MKISFKKIPCLLLTVLMISVIACQKITGDTTEIDKSLDPIEEVVPVTSGDNVSLIVNINAKKQAYFDLELRNVQSNTVIDNGTWDGWCIDVFKSIDSNAGVYKNIKLFSTDLVEKWMPVNYLLNIQEELKVNDEEITWLEIQLSIWSLRANPKFSLDDVSVEELPGQFHNDGQPLFSYQKVEEILQLVESGYKQFDYTKKGTKFAVVAELPVDVQTVFVVVEKN